MTMITPSYLGETIEYSSLHACRSTLEDPTLIDTLVDRLTGNLHLNTPVERITRTEVGYHLHLKDDRQMTARGLIIATPATVAAQLLDNLAPDSAAELRRIRYAGVGSASLMYQKSDIPRPLDAYGLVIPSSANRPIDGMQWSSAKWQHRAPKNAALLRIFFGGPHTRYMLNKSEDEILEIIQAELAELMGIRAEPNYVRVATWKDAYPQYDVGHIDLVQRIEDRLPFGVALAGNAYHGVGVPDTVRTAQRAVDQVMIQKV